MAWNMNEAIVYYRKQGAPADQSALTALLREIQAESGGRIPRHVLPGVAAGLGTKESLLLALIRRLPSLHLGDTHCLEVCAGPNCGRSTALAAAAEKMRSETITVRFVPCMRMCSKGPNVRWDGKLYHRADEALLRGLCKGE